MPTQYSGGTAKIADSTVFNVSTQIAVAEVTVEPGAMREMHWHPTENEWGFFLYVSASSYEWELSVISNCSQRGHCPGNDLRRNWHRADV